MLVDQKPLHIKSLALNALTETTKRHSSTLDTLAKQVAELHRFVYGYTIVPKPSLIVRDDEILNWTFGDVCDDLNAAGWNLACGFYKPAGTLLRSALDLGVASLYFQVQHDTRPNDDVYDHEFGKWDSGEADTPRWSSMLNALTSLPTTTRFDAQQGRSLTKEVREHYRYLCSFTHSRAYTRGDQAPMTNINMGIDAPQFDEASFGRLRLLFQHTVGWLATLWLVTYPTILEAKPLGDVTTARQEYLNLLSISRASDVFDFAMNEVGLRN